MTVVLVLGLIAIALALSYALLRTQSVSQQIQYNSQRRNQARQAAVAGLHAGLRRMRLQAWIDDGGIASTLNGKISDTDTYTVTFATGDPSLAPGDDDYDDWPYRVTVLSTGHSYDPANNVNASHKVLAVVRLVPQALSTEPANWQSLLVNGSSQPYTVYQWSGADALLELSLRIEGPARFQGPLKLADTYPDHCRPFDGRIDEVAIFPKVLSALELLAIYSSSLAPGGIAASYNDQGPLAWWRLNESAGATTAVDQKGAYHGTYRGPTCGVSGINGTSSASFDGEDDCIDLGGVDLGGDNATWVAWIKADDFDFGDARILSKATGTNESEHYWMLSTVNTGGVIRPRFRLRAGGNTSTLVPSTGSIPANTWVFLAATYDGNYMKLYVNGTQVGQMSKSGTINTNSAARAYIGDNPPGSAKYRYLEHLEAKRADGGPDHRPLTGPIDMPIAGTAGSDLQLVQDALQVSTNDVSSGGTQPLAHPGAPTSYQLYSGGQSYSIPRLGATLSSTSLEPDPVTNPLGVIVRESGLTLYDDVTVRGTLITDASDSTPDLHLAGTNIQLSAVDMEPLEGTTDLIRLPTAIVKDDVRMEDGAEAAFEGMTIVWDNFNVRLGSVDTSLDFQGRLLAANVVVEQRTEWDAISLDQWNALHTEFSDQQSAGGSVAYFPDWVEQREGLVAEPQLRLRPDPPAASYHYHWQDWSQPIYVPEANDDGLGLKWDLLDWVDNAP